MKAQNAYCKSLPAEYSSFSDIAEVHQHAFLDFLGDLRKRENYSQTREEFPSTSTLGSLQSPSYIWLVPLFRINEGEPTLYNLHIPPVSLCLPP